jgi:hypothetical protein
MNLFSDLLTELGVGSIFIVSNADLNWVHNCLKHFLPELNEYIEENHIKIYSAKKLFSKNLSMEKWKVSFIIK